MRQNYAYIMAYEVDEVFSQTEYSLFWLRKKTV